jgi:arginine/lysine/ornithine decarboxylase
LRENFGSKIFEYDITEIEGMDNLQNPQGIIKETEDKIKKSTGGEQVFLLVNGSTAGLLAAIYGLGRNKGVFAGGNCHQAVYNGMLLAGSTPVFLPVDIDQETGVELGVSPETLEKAIKEFPEIKLLILTMPNYYGLCYRYEEIMTVAKRNNIKIIIDEAHGAHFNFLEDSCPNGIKAGGDIVVQSWHKTFPVFNQGSILIQGQDLEGVNLRESINMFQTTSPSYLIMSTLDKAADYMSENRQKIIDSGKKWKEFSQKLDFQNLMVFSRKDGFKDLLKSFFLRKKRPGIFLKWYFLKVSNSTGNS